MTKLTSIKGKSLTTLFLSIAILLSGFFMLPNMAIAQGPILCDGTLDPGNGSQDLLIASDCNVGSGEYRYRDVNIIANGTLNFMDDGGDIDFWANSILVENGGTMKAGDQSDSGAFGQSGNTLTIYLYGSDSDLTGISCASPQVTSGVPCGIDRDIWNSNTLSTKNPTSCVKNDLPGGVEQECFYQYGEADPISGETGFFGAKVLGVSYGGTLELYGKKGATYSTLPSSNSGKSWARLNTGGILGKTATSLTLDRSVDWDVGDHVVLTTTDYLPGHSEKLEITGKTSDTQFSFEVLNPHTNEEIPGGLQYPHNGMKYPIDLPNGDRLKQKKTEAETRAAVALLSRSIRVVSAGNNVGDMFGGATPGNFYGGQTMFRQGFEKVHVQGVEFYQLGQGGRKGRYPVHFHLARKVPDGTFARDNSVHDSMTRWITLHGSQNVELSRNVGFMSIGHGYYLEDGTETDNKLYSNIGILARAAIINDQNPRQVPGILAFTQDKAAGQTDVPFRSDYLQPTVFWIMNGWNDFEYNMAAGANTCGACYWWLPAQISGPSEFMKWESYASQQSNPGRAGDTPLKKFKGNYCTSAMNSFNTPNDISPCKGMDSTVQPTFDPVTVGNRSPLPPSRGGMDLKYYPQVPGAHTPTFCEGTDCSTSPPTCSASDLSNCAVTVIEDYTTAFHWTEVNFSAIWLRPQWYLVLNSVISDTLGAGLTFVTGGDYTLSNFLPGQWQLARQNIFIGATQAEKTSENYASPTGPVNPGTDLNCEDDANGFVVNNRCVIRSEGLIIPLDPFNYQRLYNIYDGPNFQDSNAFLNVKKQHIADCMGGGNCSSSKWMYGRPLGMPKDPKVITSTRCIMPNAAVAWKQPNGFYYPPAFHSSNLFFNDVDIRHFVVQPLFKPISETNPFAFLQDDAEVGANYCTFAFISPDTMLGGTFSNFTAIDRQTILNDDDGTLTGLIETISVNQDSFFDAPIETVECASLQTAKTSPYQHVTTVVYPGCVAKGDCGGTCRDTGQACADSSQCLPASGTNLCDNTSWTDDCANGNCYGVPLYRQYLTGTEKDNTVGEQIRMMGMNFFQRSNLTANNGIYYIDTTLSKQEQRDGIILEPLARPSLNVFEGGETYYVLFIFAQESTKQTYLIYVGDGFDPETNVSALSSELKSSRPLDVRDESWPAGWTRKFYVDSDGVEHTDILEVSVDFSGFKSQFDEGRMDRCQPESFCKWDGTASAGSCKCSTDLSPELYEECTQPLGADNNTICSWSVRAVDCPQGGCRGFAFTLPSGFDAAAITQAPPTPECFPSENPDGSRSVWNIDWNVASTDIAGPGCDVKPLPRKNFCDDTLETETVRNVIMGTEGDDELIGTNGADLIMGLGGNDIIRGKGGNDEIEGGPGDDIIFGNAGNDRLVGGEGNDMIKGGPGHDDAFGQEGDDTILGGRGLDDLSGGDGNDLIRGQNGNDELDGNAGDDMVEGGRGADDIDGGPGNDVLMGQGGGDEIDGGSGDDMIEGGGGPDNVDGGPGNDTCIQSEITDCES